MSETDNTQDEHVVQKVPKISQGHTEIFNRP